MAEPVIREWGERRVSRDPKAFFQLFSYGALAKLLTKGSDASKNNKPKMNEIASTNHDLGSCESKRRCEESLSGV